MDSHLLALSVLPPALRVVYHIGVATSFWHSSGVFGLLRYCAVVTSLLSSSLRLPLLGYACLYSAFV